MCNSVRFDIIHLKCLYLDVDILKYGIWNVKEPQVGAVNALVGAGYAPLVSMVLSSRSCYFSFLLYRVCRGFTIPAAGVFFTHMAGMWYNKVPWAARFSAA